ncbi:hypothetical protein [Candidatus Nitrosocosmicus sp. R]|jgi:hypothetical protein
MLDYFEMERVIEELAKAYPAQCATTWFKITRNHKPSEEDYRNKVVEYMKIFEYLLATYPPGPDTDRLKELVKRILAKEIEKVLKGDNKDVERRHKHYVMNSPSPVYSNDTLKEVSEQQYLEKSTDITKVLKKRQKNSNDVKLKGELENQEIHNENHNMIVNNRRRKKKLMTTQD